MFTFQIVYEMRHAEWKSPWFVDQDLQSFLNALDDAAARRTPFKVQFK